MKTTCYNPANDTFSYTDKALPSPGPNDVLVKVLACGLNPVDAKINLWHGAAPGMNADWVPGLDVTGEIVELGSEVSGWSVGDKVLYHGDMFRPNGGFAEFAIHAAATLIPMPKVAPEIAAATPCAGWTAWRALVDKLDIERHNALFVAGGSGGVGSFALQIARGFGLEKVITSCSAINHEFVKSQGATHAIDYRSQDVVSELLKITDGAGVPIALDTVGGDNDILCASVLGYEGEMVELVQTVRPELYPDAFMKGLSFHQLSLGSGHRNGVKAVADLVRAGTDFSAWLEQGKLQVEKLTEISLSDVGDALKQIREQRTVGKIVLVN
ncbi:alcohol dehydrogenase catalytic domain-containing protein [Corallincola platygyrae]|uniref:Alcohol dehydrogenase catalytic domain-containing protein n=1 Tax=Corallincola platygyrae TaxID=1193278 RepID=A0ABW4XRI9_9GAMM